MQWFHFASILFGLDGFLIHNKFIKHKTSVQLRFPLYRFSPVFFLKFDCTLSGNLLDFQKQVVWGTWLEFTKDYDGRMLTLLTPNKLDEQSERNENKEVRKIKQDSKTGQTNTNTWWINFLILQSFYLQN